jgi:hypothetical protein
MQNIEIQTGKRYVMRNGEITGVMTEKNDVEWTDGELAWYIDGSYWVTATSSQYDIVSEYTDQSKATETEREITRMVKSKGLDPAVWCWVSVDGYGVYAYTNEPTLCINGDYMTLHNFIKLGDFDTTEPQLFKFNPFYDNEEQN